VWREWCELALRASIATQVPCESAGGCSSVTYTHGSGLILLRRYAVAPEG